MIVFAVIDTNVLVSAMLSSHDDAATVQIIKKLFTGDIIPLYNAEILDEYYDVLYRDKFPFPENEIITMLTVFEKYGICVDATPSGVSLPDMKDLPLGALFENNQRSYNKGAMEYDAIVGNTIILSHLDGDIARLIRFRDALVSQDLSYEVVCYPWQTGFLRSYLGRSAGIRELSMDAGEAALGI